MTVSTLTLNVALAIGGNKIFNQIGKFSKEANENEYTMFTHYNFFYSYPIGKDCQFHQVNTKCHLCDHTPERNYAGVGTIYLLNNGVCNDDILIPNGHKIERGRKVLLTKYVKNTPSLSRMILLCENHIKDYFQWSPIKKKY